MLVYDSSQQFWWWCPPPPSRTGKIPFHVQHVPLVLGTCSILCTIQLSHRHVIGMFCVENILLRILFLKKRKDNPVLVSWQNALKSGWMPWCSLWTVQVPLEAKQTCSIHHHISQWELDLFSHLTTEPVSEGPEAFNRFQELFFYCLMGTDAFCNNCKLLSGMVVTIYLRFRDLILISV